MNLSLFQKKLARTFHLTTKINKFGNDSLDSSKWPLSWKKVHFKTYPRFTKINLPKEDKISKDLKKIFFKRESRRNFSEEEINLPEIGTLLYFSAGIVSREKNLDKSRRFYPSAGGRYPLETYLAVTDIPGLENGLYHYNVIDHCLELLVTDEKINDKMEEITGQGWVRKAKAVIIISAVFGRTEIKYGERAYRYILFEAGHLGQNVCLVSEALGVKCCAIGGFLDTKMNELIDIDEDQEAALYMFALGK